MSPVWKYWGRGYKMCELPQAKPKTVLSLSSLNFKASPFSLMLLWSLCSGHRRCLGGPPLPSSPWAREWPHALVLGFRRQGRKDRADKYTLASLTAPLGKVNYTHADCAYPRQIFSTVWLCAQASSFLTPRQQCRRPRGTPYMVGRL